MTVLVGVLGGLALAALAVGLGIVIAKVIIAIDERRHR